MSQLLYAVPRRDADLERRINAANMAGLGGFRPAGLGPDGPMLVKSTPIFTRGWVGEEPEALAALKRGDFAELDVNASLSAITQRLDAITRGVTSGMTGFPVRENLEAQAKVLVPLDTPMRNRIPRVPGSGVAAAWRQATSLGGGWDPSTYDQPGGVASAQVFYAESGAPASLNTVYAAKSSAYKLIGTIGSVTRFAMAAGANFQPQYSTEKSHALMNLMLIEEFALINGDATATAVPWGDGANALSYNGLINLITTANGVPSANVATAVGALTTAHIDAQLGRLWKQGGRGYWMLMNAQEVQSLTVLAEAAGSIIRIAVQGSGADAGKGIMGYKVTGYLHPITGEQVPVIASRFLPAGTILFGSDYLPDGNPAVDISVLPQVEMPQLAPLESIQGYAAQELAPSSTAPDVLPFLVSLYSVPRLKGATVFGKSTGVTAVT